MVLLKLEQKRYTHLDRSFEMSASKLLYLKECPTCTLPQDCSIRSYSAAPREGLYLDSWSRGIAETTKGPVWTGISGTYRLERSSWKKICGSTLKGSVITACNEKVMSIGGIQDGQFSNSAKELDEAKNKWTDLPSMLVPCHNPCVASIGSDNIAVMGGMGAGNVILDIVQVFNVSTKKWHRSPLLPRECWGASCVVHRDTIFLAGGAGMANLVWSAKIDELVHISTDDTHTIWKQLPNLPYHYATLCAVNDVLIAIGGKYDERCSSTTTSCLYAFNGQQWQHIGEMSSKGYWLDVAVLHQREMLVLDGCSLAVMKGDVEAIAEFRKQQSAMETVMKMNNAKIEDLQQRIFHHENELMKAKKECEIHVKEKKDKEDELKQLGQRYEMLQAQVQAQIQPLLQYKDRCKKYADDEKAIRAQYNQSIGRLKNQRSALEIQVTEARQEVIDLLSAMARDRKHSNELLEKEIKHFKRESAYYLQQDGDIDGRNMRERACHRLENLESHQRYIQHFTDVQHQKQPEKDFKKMYPDGLQSSPQLWDFMSEVAAKIPNKWKDIAVQLKLSFELIQSIEDSSLMKSNDCYMQVFAAWKGMRQEDALPHTWESLLTVLASPHVCCNDLEATILAKFQISAHQRHLQTAKGLKKMYYGLDSYPQLWDLMNEVAAVAPHKWKDIAIQLKLKYEWVESMQDRSMKPNDCYMHIFHKWANYAGAMPYTWETLLTVLVEPAVSLGDLEHGLRLKFTLASDV